MSEGLPDPLVPLEVDLRGLDWMPFYGNHLFGSEFNARSSDAGWRAGVTLWWAAWNQQPAASLPSDDIALCRLADLGRDLKAWRKVKAEALHGFIECSDGRLYHPFLAELALEAWQRRQRERDKKKRWRRGITVSERQWLALRKAAFERDGHRCVACGSTQDLQCEHKVPVSSGGETALENLQTLCRPCNSGKRDRTPEMKPENGRRTRGEPPENRSPPGGERSGEPPENGRRTPDRTGQEKTDLSTTPLGRSDAEVPRARARGAPPPPEWVNAKAWQEFEAHRKAIRKPLNDLARAKNLQVLEGLSHEQQQAVVDRTIANRWTGLFPPKPGDDADAGTGKTRSQRA